MKNILILTLVVGLFSCQGGQTVAVVKNKSKVKSSSSISLEINVDDIVDVGKSFPVEFVIKSQSEANRVVLRLHNSKNTSLLGSSVIEIGNLKKGNTVSSIAQIVLHEAGSQYLRGEVEVTINGKRQRLASGVSFVGQQLTSDSSGYEATETPRSVVKMLPDSELSFE